jgi:hypothetical protein
MSLVRRSISFLFFFLSSVFCLLPLLLFLFAAQNTILLPLQMRCLCGGDKD